jgi:hypothetical protein
VSCLRVLNTFPSYHQEVHTDILINSDWRVR